MAAMGDTFVLFMALPPVLQEHVSRRLVDMAERGSALTEFDRMLVEINPAPSRTTNGFKWRTTQPVRQRLSVPTFYLEMDLIRSACESWAPRPQTNSDMSGLVFQARISSSCESLLDFVAEKGMEALGELVRSLMSRIRIGDANLRQVVISHARKNDE